MIKNLIKGLAFGTVVGGTLGILLAPKSGKATRQQLVDGVDEATDLTNDLTDSLAKFQQSLSHLQTTASELLPTFQEETTQLIEDFEFQATPRVEEINKQVDKISRRFE